MSDKMDMTKREYFAAMAMQGLCAFSGHDGTNMPLWQAPTSMLASRAVTIADDLLSELEKDRR